MPNLPSKRRITAKCLVYGGVVFILAVLQSTFFAVFRLWGAIPDLLLGAVLTVAVIEDERAGAVVGVAAGFFVESAGGVGFTVLPLYYMLCGYVCGVCAVYMLRRNFASWFVYTLIAYISRAAVTLIYMGATLPELRIITIFFDTLVPEYFGSLICAVPIYFLTRLCARAFYTKEQLRG